MFRGWLPCPIEDDVIGYPLPVPFIGVYREGDQTLIQSNPADPPAQTIGYNIGDVEAIAMSGKLEAAEAINLQLVKRDVYADVLVDYLDPFPLLIPINWPRKDAPTGLRAAWLEVWSDAVALGGTRLWFIGDATSISDYLELGGREQLQFKLPRTSRAWEYLRERRVIRVVYEDLSWEEWRVIRTGGERTERNALTGDVEAESMLYDLGRSVYEEYEANGTLTHVYFRYGLLPEQHIEQILQNALTLFVLGTVDPVEILDLEEGETTSLSLLRKLAESTNSELELIRGLDNRYGVNLRTEIGSEDPKPRLVLGRNMRGLRVAGDATEQLTRAYPFGVLVDGIRWTMAEAIWEITAVNGNRLTLGGGAIGFDDQLNGFYIELSGTATRAQVTDTFYQTQEIDVTDATGFVLGDLIHVRRDATGSRLTYLDHPLAKAEYGTFPATVIRDDIPGIDNLLGNPFLENWDAGLPLRWYAVGAPTITQNLAKLYKKNGSASAFIEALAADEGIESDWVAVVPTAERPYGSLQTVLFLLAGAVKLELFTSDGTVQTLFPPGGEATTTERHTWVENLMIKGIDLLDAGAIMVKARITSQGGAASWYVDAVQFTQTAGGAEYFYSGLASNDLWRAANRALRERSSPARTIEVSALDLYRLDPERFRFDMLKRGVTAIVEDESLAPTGEQVRITAVRRDLLVPARTEVTLSTRPPDLTQIVAKPSQRLKRSSGGLPSARPPEEGTTQNPAPTVSNVEIRTVQQVDMGGGMYQVAHQFTWAHNDAIAQGNTATPGRYTVKITERQFPMLTPAPPPVVQEVNATVNILQFFQYTCSGGNFENEACQYTVFTYEFELWDNNTATVLHLLNFEREGWYDQPY